jgi:flagellar protein FliO/FliZ
MAVGQRERIALVEVRGDILLIGVTSGAVSLLARWPAATAAPACEDTADAA